MAHFTRLFAGTSRVIVGLSGEITERWLNGTLTKALASEYQTPREQIEFLIWRELADEARELRRAAAAATAVVLIALFAGHAAMTPAASEIAWRAPRSARSRRKKGLDGRYCPLELRQAGRIAA